MGLNDILTGVLNGPRGQSQPSGAGSGGGMSPMLMALLGLVAYKAYKGLGSQAAPPAGQASAANSGGGLGDILGGLFGGTPGVAPTGGSQDTAGLGGLLGGAAAGSVLSSGLSNLIKGFQESGHGGVAQSWVGGGPNQEIAPNDLAKALWSDTIDAISRQTGMGHQELLGQLSDVLPRFVDQLTPQGRLPTEEEAARMG